MGGREVVVPIASDAVGGSVGRRERSDVFGLEGDGNTC